MDTSKVIRGVVNSGRYTVTAPIVKEDYGLYLQIEGVELPSTYEVDFSNNEHHGTSITMIGNSDGVLIPHQFISTGKDIFAFLYHVGANYGRTVYKFRIPNKCRPDRTEEQPTPEEQSVIDQAISALNEAVAQTAQDVIDADASAQASAESARASANSAVQASLSESNAERAKGNAQASAENASASATASAQSASEAETARQATTSLVAEAQGYANASEQSATASANSAEQAESAKGVAQSYAQDAQTSATYASMSESTASSKAEEASGYATTASNKATESAQSATNASQSAQTAEQAKTDAQTAQGLAESARDLAQGYAEDAQGYANDAQASAEGISASASQIAQNTANILKAFPTDTASGAVASFTDGADDIPLKSLIVNIDPVQDTSSGDPSPENICPISGWTVCNVSATGNNLLGGSKLLANAQNYIPNGTTNTEEEYFQFSSGASLNYDYRFSTDVPFKENTKYTFVFTLYKTSGLGSNIRVIYTDGSYSVIPQLSSAGVKETVVYTSSNNKTILNVSKTNSSGSTRIYYNESGVFEGVLTVLDFEPYKGQTIPLSWQTEAGTVYGGKLDVLTGKLTVYPYYASYNGETLTGRWISDRDVYAVGTTPTIGAQVVNVGAEGTEIQLEPHEVASLLGANNIFADTGDCSVEYRADTKLYINRLTEPDADMIADSNIVSGQYFMVGNTLYKATANIANGGQIIVGTNATRVSFAQALNEINA